MKLWLSLVYRILDFRGLPIWACGLVGSKEIGRSLLIFFPSPGYSHDRNAHFWQFNLYRSSRPKGSSPSLVASSSSPAHRQLKHLPASCFYQLSLPRGSWSDSSSPSLPSPASYCSRGAWGAAIFFLCIFYWASQRGIITIPSLCLCWNPSSFSRITSPAPWWIAQSPSQRPCSSIPPQCSSLTTIFLLIAWGYK